MYGIPGSQYSLESTLTPFNDNDIVYADIDLCILVEVNVNICDAVNFRLWNSHVILHEVSLEWLTNGNIVNTMVYSYFIDGRMIAAR
jgi:hypothetical protein